MVETLFLRSAGIVFSWSNMAVFIFTSGSSRLFAFCILWCIEAELIRYLQGSVLGLVRQKGRLWPLGRSWSNYNA